MKKVIGSLLFLSLCILLSCGSSRAEIQEVERVIEPFQRGEILAIRQVAPCYDSWSDQELLTLCKELQPFMLSYQVEIEESKENFIQGTVLSPSSYPYGLKISLRKDRDDFKLVEGFTIVQNISIIPAVEVD